MAGGLLDVEVSYLQRDRDPIVTTVGQVDVASVLKGVPVRRVRSYAGQRHYSGLFWSATTSAHLAYESRLELSRMLLADFDQDVEWMASQPMWLRGRDGAETRRHVPDLLIRRRGGEYLICDVKPAEFAQQPEIAAVFDWTSRVCAACGWRYEVWTGANAVILANVRFLAAGRRLELVDADVLAVLKAVGRDGLTIGELSSLAERSGAPASRVRPAVLAMIWWGVWSVELGVPLSSQTVITVCVGVS